MSQPVIGKKFVYETQSLVHKVLKFLSKKLLFQLCQVEKEELKRLMRKPESRNNTCNISGFTSSSRVYF